MTVPPNATRHQQVILLDPVKAQALDQLSKQTGVAKQALMREAIDDLLSVYGFIRSPRIHRIRNSLSQCELILRKVRRGKLPESDIQVACAEVLFRVAGVLEELGEPKKDR
jgi:hypothetical protein